MADDKQNLDDWLIDDQLDQLSPAERSQFEAALENDPELARRRSGLQRTLEPLDHWSVSAPPDGLVTRILQSIEAEDARRTVVPASSLANSTDRGRVFRPSFRMQDIVAVAASIVILFALLVPGLSNMRDRSRRMLCASNLGSIGRALGAYAAANSSALPSARMIAGGSWLPASTAGIPYTPNSRSRYLLLRFRYVGKTEAFVCPSRPDAVRLDMKNPQALNDFPDPRNCCYDSLNMAGNTPNYSKLCDMPYMADANPLFAGGRFNRIDPTRSNSRNHRCARGQNVLCLNGSVAWFENPNCGPKRDNIWQVESLTVYRGTECQTRKDDSFLTP